MAELSPLPGRRPQLLTLAAWPAQSRARQGLVVATRKIGHRSGQSLYVQLAEVVPGPTSGPPSRCYEHRPRALIPTDGVGNNEQDYRRNGHPPAPALRLEQLKSALPAGQLDRLSEDGSPWDA